MKNLGEVFKNIVDHDSSKKHDWTVKVTSLLDKAVYLVGISRDKTDEELLMLLAQLMSKIDIPVLLTLLPRNSTTEDRFQRLCRILETGSGEDPNNFIDLFVWFNEDPVMFEGRPK